MNTPAPVVGDWYRAQDGTIFEVVAIDRDDGTIEVQYFDGTIEEIDAETWIEQRFDEAEAPEDWSGSVDIEPEDYQAERDVGAPTVWADPLEYLDRSEAPGYSEWPSPSDDRLD